MIIYVVMSAMDYSECAGVDSVWSTPEAAEARAAEVNAQDTYTAEDGSIRQVWYGSVSQMTLDPPGTVLTTGAS